jgi:hypothetical protein
MSATNLEFLGQRVHRPPLGFILIHFPYEFNLVVA